MKQNYHGHIYYDVEDQRKDTVDSAVTVADFTDQDRLDFLRGQYYVRFTSEYSTEESKSNFPSLKTTWWVQKFDIKALKWTSTGVDISEVVDYQLHPSQYLYIKEMHCLMLIGIRQNSTSQNNINDLDTLGEKWYLINLDREQKISEVPSLPTPKTMFWSVKVESTVYVIGGCDDKQTWYCLDVMPESRDSQLKHDNK